MGTIFFNEKEVSMYEFKNTNLLDFINKYSLYEDIRTLFKKVLQHEVDTLNEAKNKNEDLNMIKLEMIIELIEYLSDLSKDTLIFEFYKNSKFSLFKKDNSQLIENLTLIIGTLDLILKLRTM